MCGNIIWLYCIWRMRCFLDCHWSSVKHEGKREMIPMTVTCLAVWHFVECFWRLCLSLHIFPNNTKCCKFWAQLDSFFPIILHFIKRFVFFPPCQAILLSLNHSVHLHPPSSEYFKRVKWKCKQKTSGTAQQKARCQSALFIEGKAQLFYLLTRQFIYLFVWLNLLWDEGKGSRDHGREELSLCMSDHMMQSACVTDIAWVFF